jgi:hypothetical protein
MNPTEVVALFPGEQQTMGLVFGLLIVLSDILVSDLLPSRWFSLVSE